MGAGKPRHRKLAAGLWSPVSCCTKRWTPTPTSPETASAEATRPALEWTYPVVSSLRSPEWPAIRKKPFNPREGPSWDSGMAEYAGS